MGLLISYDTQYLFGENLPAGNNYKIPRELLQKKIACPMNICMDHFYSITPYLYIYIS